MVWRGRVAKSATMTRGPTSWLQAGGDRGAMSWIESHQTLREHPKTYALMEALGLKKPEVIGHLHLFWWWCVDYAPEGRFKADESKKISRAAEYLGDAGKFAAAMVEAGFLDRDGEYLVVHDWEQFQFHYHLIIDKKERQREQARERMRRKRAKSDSDADVTRNKSVSYAPVTQCSPPTDRTVPDSTGQTVQDRTDLESKDGGVQKADPPRPQDKREGPESGLPGLEGVRGAAEIPRNQRRASQEPSKRFVPPTPKEAEGYAAGIGFKLDGARFVDYYEARGWKYKGGVAMKDWKAAVRTWKRSGGDYGERIGERGVSPGGGARDEGRKEQLRRLGTKVPSVPGSDGGG